MSTARIPPIHCLLAFEALARLRSVSQAADELNVTPSAISHRLRQLEALWERRLFDRSDFSLTADGQACLAPVRDGLAALQQVPAPLGQPAASARLRLAVTPTFSRQLLLPRLALFRHACPEVELVLQVAVPMLESAKGEDGEQADLEIRFGAGGYPGVEQMLLLSDEVTPVCSPEYLNEHGPFEGFDRSETVARAHLIRSPLEPWATWFQACGIGLAEPRDGAQFNDVGLVLDAAAAGFGVALLRRRLGASWLESGRLVRLSPRAVASPHHHHLCWRPGAMERWPCAAFAEWLRAALAS